jgi:methanogenic corrinoid protein MtbC1
MVAEFFRRAGWHVWSLPLGTAQEMAALARREWFAVVGLSAACPSRIDALAAAIRMIRRSSRNRAVGIMVGGPLVLSQPDLVPLVGADATAVDARQAVLQAQDLLALLAERR